MSGVCPSHDADGGGGGGGGAFSLPRRFLTASSKGTYTIYAPIATRNNPNSKL